MEEDTWNKITDIRANGSLSHFLSYFSVMELSSPFLQKFWIDMEMTKENGKFVMNHENLLYGIEYVISFMNEVKAVTSNRLKYYKYPQLKFARLLRI